MRALAQLASGAAHEINNPLGFVASNLRTLRESVGAEGAAGVPGLELVELIDECLHGVRRVEDIVKALRELGDSDEMDEADHAEVGPAVRRAVRQALGEQGRCELSLQATAHAAIAPPLLERALTHVLRNARQASPTDEGIRVSSVDRDGTVVVEVTDAGCGIAPEVLPRIFEPFFTTRPVGGGTGLGLTSAWGIARRHGGSLELSSELGRGTTATFVFPAMLGPVAPGR
ncbi:MAG: HAMP domain-containing histidine kinase [Myxococcaceae bacterium]|nr:HAMP domain-containing histidine kinase [Myxococcaceae bacterium]